MKRLTRYAGLIAGASLLTAGLGGCSGYTEGWKINAAQEICAQRGGIDHLSNFMGTSVVCRDGFFAATIGKP